MSHSRQYCKVECALNGSAHNSPVMSRTEECGENVQVQIWC